MQKLNHNIDYEQSLNQLMGKPSIEYKGVPILIEGTQFVIGDKHFSNLTDARGEVDRQINNQSNEQ